LRQIPVIPEGKFSPNSFGEGGLKNFGTQRVKGELSHIEWYQVLATPQRGHGEHAFAKGISALLRPQLIL